MEIVKIILTIIQLLSGLALIAIIMLQSGKGSGISGAIGGGNDSYSFKAQAKTMDAKLFIPAHAEPTDDIAPLAQVNIDAVARTADQILSLCTEPVTFDELIGRLFDSLSLTLSLQQYVLVGSTVKSYLSYLTDRGEIAALCENNRLFWKRI